MKKIMILFLSLLLCGCAQSTPYIDLGKDITISYFYIDTCSDCRAFKNEVIPLLQETFQDHITIEQYDLDSEHVTDVYDPIIDSLVDFDEEFYGVGPFIVVNDYFAILGYTSGDEDYLIQDIQNAVKGKPLGYELEGRRFVYK